MTKKKVTKPKRSSKTTASSSPNRDAAEKLERSIMDPEVRLRWALVVAARAADEARIKESSYDGLARMLHILGLSAQETNIEWIKEKGGALARAETARRKIERVYQRTTPDLRYGGSSSTIRTTRPELIRHLYQQIRQKLPKRPELEHIEHFVEWLLFPLVFNRHEAILGKKHPNAEKRMIRNLEAAKVSPLARLRALLRGWGLSDTEARSYTKFLENKDPED